MMYYLTSYIENSKKYKRKTNMGAGIFLTVGFGGTLYPVLPVFVSGQTPSSTPDLPCNENPMCHLYVRLKNKHWPLEQ